MLHQFARSVLTHWLLIGFVAGCVSISPDRVATSTPSSLVIATPEIIPTIPTQIQDSFQKLRIWLPPDLDFSSGSPAGIILYNRLQEFRQIHLNVQLDIRIKSSDSPGGFVQLLESTSNAAPTALPDLVLLNRPMLEIAAEKQLLIPIREQDENYPDTVPYYYTSQSSLVNNVPYGVPMSGNFMVLVYKNDSEISPPTSFQALQDGSGRVGFPAADRLSLTTLALYQAAVSISTDIQDRAILQEQSLVEVLTLYQQGLQKGVFPKWISEVETDEQAWEAFLSGKTDFLITWADSFIKHSEPGLAITALPTPYGNPYTMGNGWLWAFTNQDRERLNLSIQLTDYLSESAFLASLTEAWGYPAPTPAAQKKWQDQNSSTILDRLSLISSLSPMVEFTTLTASPLYNATLSIFNESSTPEKAAADAIASLIKP